MQVVNLGCQTPKARCTSISSTLCPAVSSRPSDGRPSALHTAFPHCTSGTFSSRPQPTDAQRRWWVCVGTRTHTFHLTVLNVGASDRAVVTQRGRRSLTEIIFTHICGCVRIVVLCFRLIFPLNHPNCHSFIDISEAISCRLRVCS